MKKLTIFHRITSGLVLFFFLPGALMNITGFPDWIEGLKVPWYPAYLLRILGVAKLCGCLVIVLPHFNRLKQWAYVGLSFDVVDAIYCALTVSGFDPSLLPMFAALGVLPTSYWLWRKRQTAGLAVSV